MSKRAANPEMHGGLFAIKGGQSTPLSLAEKKAGGEPAPRTKKTDAKPAKKPGRRASLKELKATDLTAFNESAEEKFQRQLCKMIREEGELTVYLVKKELAFACRVSTETIKRYLDKYTSRRAHFRFTDEGKVTCRHET